MEAIIPSSCESASKEKPSQIIITLVAEREGISPVELTPPLYSVIDSEALDSLFHSPIGVESQPPVCVDFTYNGYEIHVHSEDGVSISKA